jgi:hypothetical protein
LRSRSDSNDPFILNDDQSIAHHWTLGAIKQPLRFDSPFHSMLLLTVGSLALIFARRDCSAVPTRLQA